MCAVTEREFELHRKDYDEAAWYKICRKLASYNHSVEELREASVIKMQCKIIDIERKW